MGALAAEVLLAPIAAQAGDDPPAATVWQVKPTTASIFKFDYGAPTSPALALGGLSPDKTTTSTALKPFVLSLPYFVGGHAASQAIAFDFAPAQFYWADKNYSAYEASSWWARWLARTRVESLGFRGQRDSDPKKQTASKIGVGVSLSLLDYSDPFFAHEWTPHGPGDRFSWDLCTSAAMPKFDALLRVPSPAAQEDEIYGLALAILHELQARDGHPDQQAAYVAAPGNREALERILARINVLEGESSKKRDIPAFAKDPQFQLAEAIASAEYWAGQLSDPAQKQAVLSSLQQVRQDAERTNPPPPISAMTPGEIEAKLAAATAPKDKNQAGSEDGVLLATSKTAEAAAADYQHALALNVGYTKAVNQCADQANGWARLAPDIDIGVGQIWNGDKGAFKNFGAPGQAVWIGARYPVWVLGATADGKVADPAKATALMVGGSARFAHRESVATGDTATPNVLSNTRDIWLGGQLLGPDINLGLQYGWFHAKARDTSLSAFDQTGHEWLVSLGHRLGGEGSNTWVNLSYGKAAGATTIRNDKTVLVNITFSPPKAQGEFLQK